MTNTPIIDSEMLQFVQSKLGVETVDAAVILGSGLGGFASSLANRIEIPYEEIPGFPHSSVSGHAGTLILGEIGDQKVLCFSGRFHHYEGFELNTTVLPVRLAKAMNAKKMIITNAAGGLNYAFSIADIMIIKDTIRSFGKVSDKTKLMTHPFGTYNLHKHSLATAHELGIAVQQGTYMFVKGPTYETKSEIKAFRIMGADAVGMSTLPEITECEYLGLPYAAFSLITNLAAGMMDTKLSHDEIKVAADIRVNDLTKLVSEVICSTVK